MGVYYSSFLRNDFKISYRIWGNGRHLIFAFHGFNTDSRDFELYNESLKENFTCISIDFWEHGESTWLKSFAPNIQDYILILKEIIVIENIEYNKLSLWSFSMGERLLRNLWKYWPESIHSIILISPPSFSLTKTSNFAIKYQKLLSPIIEYFLNHSNVLLMACRFLNTIHVLNPIKFRFMRNACDHSSKLLQLWQAWKQLKFGMSIYREFTETKLLFLFGDADELSPSTGWNKILKSNPNTTIKSLNCKHISFSEAHLNALIEFYKI